MAEGNLVSQPSDIAVRNLLNLAVAAWAAAAIGVGFVELHQTTGEPQQATTLTTQR